MTHDTDNAPLSGQADIAWLRQLAEENGTAPMRGASILLAAGVIYGLTSLLHWAHITGLIAPRLVGSGLEWLIATGLFLIANVLLVLRLRRGAGVRTAGQRVVATVWAGVGCGIFFLFASMLAVSLRIGADQNGLIFWMVPSIIMVFYGLGWSVTATMLKSRPLWILGVTSFLAAPALGALSGQPAQYLGYAAALFLLMALPGFLLMRQSKSA
ncbi:MAG: hypothetical protein REJ23_00535 [Brevundimonas sp.]|nr:hypothetical protein [Brevundimonas sp.]